MKREAFLQRVRQAVVEGNRGAAPAHGEPHAPAKAPADAPRRGDAGYQGAGADPLQRFAQEMHNAGGQVHIVGGAEEACQTILPILKRRSARRILLGKSPLIDRLQLVNRLRQEGLEVHLVDDVTSTTARDTFFQADAGISGVQHLIAETGSLVMASKPEEPRSLSLLPPVHIALAEPRQILPDLFDLFDLFAPDSTPGRPPSPPPSCLTLITGPSKTGDIELRLVTGVHGPGELHVVVCVG